MTEQSQHWPSALVAHFEDQHDITIIEMRDFGSRAKNMDGPDSDTDVFMLFDQPVGAHKRLNEYVDTIDPKGEVHGADVHGWNTRKFASLLSDSNPSAIEFLNSPISYYSYHSARLAEELDALRMHANRNFNPIRLYYHAQSFARKNYEKYHMRKLIHKDTKERFRIRKETDSGYVVRAIGQAEDTPSFNVSYDDEDFRETTTDRTIRRYLKVLRSALQARHIRRTKSIPPMNFEDFLVHHVDYEIERKAMDLLDAKRQGLGDMETDGPLNDVIEYEIDYEPNNEDLNLRGINYTRTNDFLDRLDEVLY